jgi:hypothetical protein
MSDTQETTAMREALQFLIGSDIPARYKGTLIEAVTQALRSGQAAESRLAAMEKAAPAWESRETSVVDSFLREKVASSWQHADETVMRLADQLHRDPHDVRRKAIDLGFGVAVDYRLAKARAAATEG